MSDEDMYGNGAFPADSQEQLNRFLDEAERSKQTSDLARDRDSMPFSQRTGPMTKWIRRKDSRLRYIHQEVSDGAIDRGRRRQHDSNSADSIPVAPSSVHNRTPNTPGLSPVPVTSLAGLAVKPNVPSAGDGHLGHVEQSDKRGRKGTKIRDAFSAVPSTPTPAVVFASGHGVSIAVLRQRKRFDKAGTGVVRISRDKSSKMLMIWRSL